MQFIERYDLWARAHLQATLGHKRISTPAPFQILRPGEEKPEKKYETDPVVIANWFRMHMGGGGEVDGS